jgi:hypothetical protein
LSAGRENDPVFGAIEITFVEEISDAESFVCVVVFGALNSFVDLSFSGSVA